MTAKELYQNLGRLLQYGNIDPETEIVIGHYSQQDGFVDDLELHKVDWLYASASDETLPDYARKRVIELIAYEPEEEEALAR